MIQGVNNFDVDQELPLGLIISEDGLVRISIDALENIDPGMSLYIKDNSNEETYEITNEPFEIQLQAGEYNDRFALVFQSRLLSIDEVPVEDGMSVYMYPARCW